MNRIILAIVVIIGFGRLAFADDSPRVDVAFTGNEEHDKQAMETLRQAAGTAPSVGVLLPIEMQNTPTAQEAMSLVNQNLEHMRQTAIAKAEREGYVLNMDGQKYGRPDVLEKERYGESMTYVNEDGIDQTYGDGKGNMITKEEYIQNSREIAEAMIAQSKAWLEGIRSTVSDRAIIAEAERGTKEFEDNLKRDADETLAKVSKVRRKSEFAIPSSWSADKINVYNQAKDYGITLFENENDGNQTIKSDNTTAESEKEKPKSAPTARQVLVSREA